MAQRSPTPRGQEARKRGRRNARLVDTATWLRRVSRMCCGQRCDGLYRHPRLIVGAGNQLSNPVTASYLSLRQNAE